MNKIFFATPIGAVDSNEHKRSDRIVEIIDEVISKIDSELKLIRVDKLFTPQNITETIKKEIAESKFVIADISDHNPNVYYELGYATGLQKICVQIAESSNGNLPFDVAQINTIFYDLDDIKSLKYRLEGTIKHILENPSEKSIAFAGPPIGKTYIKDDQL